MSEKKAMGWKLPKLQSIIEPTKEMTGTEIRNAGLVVFQECFWIFERVQKAIDQCSTYEEVDHIEAQFRADVIKLQNSKAVKILEWTLPDAISEDKRKAYLEKC